MANMAMLEEVLGAIKMNPERHDQNSWAYEGETEGCGTTMCFAGWTTHLAGGKFVREEVDQTSFTLVDMPDGRRNSIEEEARMILGLSYSQSSELFLNTENLEEVEQVVKDIANGELL